MVARGIILYIEDDPGSQRLVQRILESHGYKVLLADGGLSGIELARRERPHLILMDINLPDMNGREITTRLRGSSGFEEIPIVALTANISPGSRERALAAGCDGFLTKPISVATFPTQVESYLKGRREELGEKQKIQHLEQHAREIVERLEYKIYELEAANERLRELDRVKSNFIVLVSHELRTPLTLLEGYMHLLNGYILDKVSISYPKELLELLDGLSKGVNRISRVINEIIHVSRIASGTLELSLGPVQLSIMMRNMVRDLDETLSARGLHVALERLEHLPFIEGDGSQLGVAIGNVIENAIKFTPDGGEIFVTGRLMDNAVDLVIRDTGIGIPTEEQRRIFDPFHVLGAIDYHSTSKSAYQGGGLGLGLPMARGIIEAHHGRIWVESVGRDDSTRPGSTFHLLLPIRQPNT